MGLANEDSNAPEMSVFLSYSRKDRPEAERISEKLKGRGFRVFRDQDDILPTEEWRERLERLIDEADAIVFLLSPHSAVSEICMWEVERANSLGKKIAPIVVKDVEGTAIPPLLSRLNYIFATEQDRLDNAIGSLCDAFSGTAEWAREYSRVVTLARDWERGGCSRANLLHGQRQIEVSAWLQQRPSALPPPGELVIRFITASEKLTVKSANYNRLKLGGIQSLLGPAIEARIKEIYKNLNEISGSIGPAHMLPTTFGDFEQKEIDDLRNFAKADSRWHPNPAEDAGNGVDDHGFSQYRWRFPCCGKEMVGSSSEQKPRQLSTDGCSGNPDL